MPVCLLCCRKRRSAGRTSRTCSVCRSRRVTCSPPACWTHFYTRRSSRTISSPSSASYWGLTRPSGRATSPVYVLTTTRRLPDYYAPRKISGEHIVVALSVRPSVRPSVSPSVRPSVRPIRVQPITLLFEVGFQNYFTEMTTMLRRRVARNIWVATLKVKVTA